MSTNAQIVANRRNGKVSHGPTTPEGKAISSQNSLKHGLISRDPLLPGESETELTGFRLRLLQELRPIGELENLLVNRIINAAWRLRRFGGVEAGVLTWELYGELEERAKQEVWLLRVGTPVKPEATRNPAECREALAREGAARRARHSVETALGRAFIRDATGPAALSRLSRYEVTLERTFFRNLHELQRLQAVRAGMHVPPPLAVDIDLPESGFLQNEPNSGSTLGPTVG